MHKVPKNVLFLVFKITHSALKRNALISKHRTSGYGSGSKRKQCKNGSFSNENASNLAMEIPPANLCKTCDGMIKTADLISHLKRSSALPLIFFLTVWSECLLCVVYVYLNTKLKTMPGNGNFKMRMYAQTFWKNVHVDSSKMHYFNIHGHWHRVLHRVWCLVAVDLESHRVFFFCVYGRRLLGTSCANFQILSASLHAWPNTDNSSKQILQFA